MSKLYNEQCNNNQHCSYDSDNSRCGFAEQCPRSAIKKIEASLANCADLAAQNELKYFYHLKTTDNSTCYLVELQDDDNSVEMCEPETRRYDITIDRERFDNDCGDCDAEPFGGSCTFPTFVETYMVQRSTSMNSYERYDSFVRTSNSFNLLPTQSPISYATTESFFFNATLKQVEIRFVIFESDMLKLGIRSGAEIRRIKLNDFMDQNSELLPVDTFVAKNISLRYKTFDAAEVIDGDAFKWGAESLPHLEKWVFLLVGQE